jgi:hypothetical protein
MKVFINITEDWKEILDAIKIAEEYLKPFDVKITYKKIDLDVSNEQFYNKHKILGGFVETEMQSFSDQIIRALGLSHGGEGYDLYGLIVDKNKSLEHFPLYGQYNSGFRTIEVYADKLKSKWWGLPRTAYSLIHELFHALSVHYNIPDTLHEWVDKNTSLDGYREQMVKQIKPVQVVGLLPLVQRKADDLIRYAKFLGLDLRITSGFRSKEEQDELYAQGRTKSGQIVTNAKGGESTHNFGVAIDIVDRKLGYELSDLQWDWLAFIGRFLGFKWGGDWKSFPDKPHFEFMLDYTLKDFQEGKVDYSRFK